MVDRERLPGALAALLRQRRPVLENIEDYLNASVLVPLLEKEDGWHVLFEQRSSDLNWQPGEICFPGGKLEAGESPISAAKRETVEELGVASDQIAVLGALNVIVAPIGVFLHPFVGVLAKDARVRANLDEVHRVFTVPLEWLRRQEPEEYIMQVGTRPLETFPTSLLPDYHLDWRGRRTYPVHFYVYEDHVIWGLTARVLRCFLRMVEESGTPSAR